VRKTPLFGPNGPGGKKPGSFRGPWGLRSREKNSRGSRVQGPPQKGFGGLCPAVKPRIAPVKIITLGPKVPAKFGDLNPGCENGPFLWGTLSFGRIGGHPRLEPGKRREKGDSLFKGPPPGPDFEKGLGPPILGSGFFSLKKTSLFKNHQRGSTGRKGTKGNKTYREKTGLLGENSFLYSGWWFSGVPPTPIPFLGGPYNFGNAWWQTGGQKSPGFYGGNFH